MDGWMDGWIARWMERDRDKDGETERDRETERKRDRQTDRQTNRQRCIYVPYISGWKIRTSTVSVAHVLETCLEKIVQKRSPSSTLSIYTLARRT